MNRPLVYLACPYSHDDASVREMRFHAANVAVGELMKVRGEIVFSPISHSHPIAKAVGLPGDWQWWQQWDRAFLSVSSKLYVLMIPGWNTSTGVLAEIKIAQEMGLPIEYLDGSKIQKP